MEDTKSTQFTSAKPPTAPLRQVKKKLSTSIDDKNSTLEDGRMVTKNNLENTDKDPQLEIGKSAVRKTVRQVKRKNVTARNEESISRSRSVRNDNKNRKQQGTPVRPPRKAEPRSKSEVWRQVSRFEQIEEERAQRQRSMTPKSSMRRNMFTSKAACDSSFDNDDRPNFSNRSMTPGIERNEIFKNKSNEFAYNKQETQRVKSCANTEQDKNSMENSTNIKSSQDSSKDLENSKCTTESRVKEESKKKWDEVRLTSTTPREKEHLNLLSQTQTDTTENKDNDLTDGEKMNSVHCVTEHFSQKHMNGLDKQNVKSSADTQDFKSYATNLGQVETDNTHHKQMNEVLEHGDCLAVVNNNNNSHKDCFSKNSKVEITDDIVKNAVKKNFKIPFRRYTMPFSDNILHQNELQYKYLSSSISKNPASSRKRHSLPEKFSKLIEITDAQLSIRINSVVSHIENNVDNSMISEKVIIGLLDQLIDLIARDKDMEQFEKQTRSESTLICEMILDSIFDWASKEIYNKSN